MKETKTKENEEKTEKALAPVEDTLKGLFEIMRAEKPGIEVNTPWIPPVVRIHQNNSRNPPAHSTPGCLYTDTGDVLEKPWKFYPLYVHQANMDIEEDDDGNLFICRSEDGIVSNRGIKCAECPKVPYKNKDRIQCRPTMEFFVLDEKLTQIYKVIFWKTGYRSGWKLMRQISGTKYPWQRKYALNVEQQTKNMHKFFVLTVSATQEQAPNEFLPLFAKLCEEITTQRKKYLESIQQQVSLVQQTIQLNVDAVKDL